jgi:hypothetical protein
MTREELETKRKELVTLRTKHIADANACLGAIQLIDELLAAEQKSAEVAKVS